MWCLLSPWLHFSPPSATSSPPPSPFDVAVPCESHFGHVCVSASSLTLTVNVCKWQRYDRSRQSSGLTHTSTKKRHIPAVHWENIYIKGQVVRELFKILENTLFFCARPFKTVEPKRDFNKYCILLFIYSPTEEELLTRIFNRKHLWSNSGYFEKLQCMIFVHVRYKIFQV